LGFAMQSSVAGSAPPDRAVETITRIASMAGIKIIRCDMAPPVDVPVRFTAERELIGRRLPVNLDTNWS
jgi:hypothetical protein